MGYLLWYLCVVCVWTWLSVCIHKASMKKYGKVKIRSVYLKITHCLFMLFLALGYMYFKICNFDNIFLKTKLCVHNLDLYEPIQTTAMIFK